MLRVYPEILGSAGSVFAEMIDVVVVWQGHMLCLLGMVTKEVTLELWVLMKVL